MHIFKSRNPLWLIGDIVLIIWLWKTSLIVSAVFFSIDTFIQLIYTFFPDAIDTWEKNKSYRYLYIFGWILAMYYIVRYFTSNGLI